MTALAQFTVGTAAAVRIVNAGGAGKFRVSALGAALYVGADNTVTVATGVPMNKSGELFELGAAGDIWAIAKDETVIVRVLSWT